MYYNNVQGDNCDTSLIAELEDDAATVVVLFTLGPLWTIFDACICTVVPKR